MEIPSISTDTPRYELTNKIRESLPLSRPTTSEEDRLLAVYRVLNPRDRAVVYRVALSLAEHAGDHA